MTIKFSDSKKTYDYRDYSYVLTCDGIHVFSDAEMTVTKKSTGEQLTRTIKSVQYGNNFVIGLLNAIRELE